MKRLRVCALFLCVCLAWVPSFASAQMPPAGKARVAVLPFTIHSAENIEYIRQGIRDMLSSRIAVADRVEVVGRDAVSEVVQPWSAKEMTFADVYDAGKKLQATFVVWGSITKIGNSISLDAKLLDMAASRSVIDIVSQSPNLDDVIPKINDFARRIDQHILGEAPATPVVTPVPMAAAPPPEPAKGSRETEIISGMKTSKKGTFTSAINPDFINAVSPVDRKNFWMSQKYRAEFKGMDIGDVNGDGLKETVVIERHKVNIYQKKDKDFKLIAQWPGKTYDNYLGVDVADINMNGIAEIFVTSIVGTQVDSFVIEWKDGKFAQLGPRLPWFLRVVNPTVDTTVLLGQRLGIGGKSSNMPAYQPFWEPAYQIVWEKGKYIEGARMKIPEGLPVFGLTITTLGSGESEKILVLDEYDHLRMYEPTEKHIDKINVFGGSNELLWKSDDVFGGSNNYFEISPATWGSDSDKERVEYVNLRIITYDTNKDGKREVIIVKNFSPAGRFFKGVRMYTASEVYNLEWDGLGMLENWKTRKINGSVADYQFKDIDNDGENEIVMALVLAEGASSRSVIVAYDMTAQ